MIDLDKYAKLLAEWSDKVTKKYEKELNSMYSELIKAALALLSSTFNSYEKDGKLTYTEMMKYKRLDSFHRQMNVLINTMSKKQRDSLLDLLEEHYEYSWDWMAWAIENEADIRLKNMKTKLDQVEKAMQNPISGLTLDETLEKNRRDIIIKVKREVTQSLVQGSTYKQTASRLTKAFEGDYVKSVRVARTETHRVREQASLESAQEANSQGIIMVKRWMNMKDERVRRTPKANHLSLGGQSVPVDKPFDLGGGETGQAPGMTGYAHHDINCRCLTGYSIERIEKQSQKDVAKRTFDEYRKAISN
ncbi:phage minor head protein [Rummeliibacillus sp. TYF-LIM-RU47]|uniref:phage minor head protein n=1 Tax=Rummeliibacillus sp. TYF-LIM-RU47 TaxID=2608406 RepID=UPI00123AA4A0|nr:phage minor head protein [Rummeliibacillus sp. TYF-LIM-RU47]